MDHPTIAITFEGSSADPQTVATLSHELPAFVAACKGVGAKRKAGTGSGGKKSVFIWDGFVHDFRKALKAADVSVRLVVFLGRGGCRFL